MLSCEVLGVALSRKIVKAGLFMLTLAETTTREDKCSRDIDIVVERRSDVRASRKKKKKGRSQKSGDMVYSLSLDDRPVNCCVECVVSAILQTGQYRGMKNDMGAYKCHPVFHSFSSEAFVITAENFRISGIRPYPSMDRNVGTYSRLAPRKGGTAVMISGCIGMEPSFPEREQLEASISIFTRRQDSLFSSFWWLLCDFTRQAG